MSKKRNILVIENQYVQFCKIYGYLNIAGYKVYPESKEEDFIKFIDNVRVWINEQNKQTLKNKAIKIIKDYINENKIELILMDHILGGPHYCKNGIDLAIELDKDVKIKKLPIIFLSKTPNEDKERDTGFDVYKEGYKENGTETRKGDLTYWIHKGYIGNRILEEAYFKQKVIKILPDYFVKTKEQENLVIIKETLNFINQLDSDYLNEYPIYKKTKKILDKITKDISKFEISGEIIEIIKKITTDGSSFTEEDYEIINTSINTNNNDTKQNG